MIKENKHDIWGCARNPFTSFYGMRMNPFAKELPTKDAYQTLDMEQMQGRLMYLKEHPGIGVFTSTPGQGKTFSLKYFSDSLEPGLVKLSYICLSTASSTDFYQQLCVSLGLKISDCESNMRQRILEYLYLICTIKNTHCMICLDEAQNLNSDKFREFDTLCRFCINSKNCFSLILLGQPTLTNFLTKQSNDAFQQHICVNYSFTGLTWEEARNYINDRLELAGATTRIFDESALLTAYENCNASLRQLNLIMTEALTIGARNNMQYINSAMMLAALHNVQDVGK